MLLIIEEPEDTVTYNNNFLTIQRAQDGPMVFSNISSLEVDSPLGLRRYYRIAPGVFSGLGKSAMYKVAFRPTHYTVTHDHGFETKPSIVVDVCFLSLYSSTSHFWWACCLGSVWSKPKCKFITTTTMNTTLSHVATSIGRRICCSLTTGS